MSAIITTWLGIVFVGLAIAAVALQAWLWSFPFDKATHTSAAPRGWILAHRAIGYSYAALYALLMTEMVPRLWRYQVELPARTAIHACLGVTIGVLLLTKISILRFFRHFEEAMPALGFGMLLCSVLMGVLSIPYSLRAQAAGVVTTFATENLARTRTALAGLDFGGPIDAAALATPAGVSRGRDVLTSKCTGCHDLRTVLLKPRAPGGWLEVVERMAEKPSIGRGITDDDVAAVTAYLVAITPELQESTRRKKAVERQKSQVVAEVAAAPPPAAPAFDPAAARPVFEKQCSQCHKLATVDKHGLDDENGWRRVVQRMIEENDAPLDAPTAASIIQFLAATRAKH